VMSHPLPWRTTWKPLPVRPEYRKPHEPDCRKRRMLPCPTRRLEIAWLIMSTA